MGMLLRKNVQGFGFAEMTKISVVSLIISLSAAFVSTVWALYVDSFVGDVAKVGYLTAFLAFVSFFSYFYFIPLMQKADKGKLFLYSLLMLGAVYLLFSFIKSFYLFLALSILFTVVLSLRVMSFGIIVKDLSKKEELSKNEGLKYTFANIAFVIGPLIAGYLLTVTGLNYVFVVSGVIVLIGALFFWESGLHDGKKSKKVNDGMLENFFSFFHSKKRVVAYILGGGVSLWWGLIYLFIPLHMVRVGLPKSYVGYFLFAVAVPLIFLEYYFAKFAGKRGFKKMFFFGYAIAAVFAFACFFVSSIYIILGLLILASLGLAMLESTVESYFFDILDEEEEYRYYGPFNTSMDLNAFVGRIAGSTLLLFLDFKYIFLLFGGFMVIMALVALKVKKVVENK